MKPNASVSTWNGGYSLWVSAVRLLWEFPGLDSSLEPKRQRINFCKYRSFTVNNNCVNFQKQDWWFYCNVCQVTRKVSSCRPFGHEWFATSGVWYSLWFQNCWALRLSKVSEIFSNRFYKIAFRWGLCGPFQTSDLCSESSTRRMRCMVWHSEKSSCSVPNLSWFLGDIWSDRKYVAVKPPRNSEIWDGSTSTHSWCLLWRHTPKSGNFLPKLTSFSAGHGI